MARGEGPYLWGSSPLSRGIPRPPKRTAPTCGDHPRSRGEYESVPMAIVPLSGSSPLSRGIHMARPIVRGSHRIIPALAGNTWMFGHPESKATDHPRSRGEYQSSASAQLCSGDHPRSRGEYAGAVADLCGGLGSSPLSRGIRGSRCTSRQPRGIIPALAGNTHVLFSVENAAADHPRSRGEYTCQVRKQNSTSGSSPLSRGIHGAGPKLENRTRIIPALAGNTQSQSR